MAVITEEGILEKKSNGRVFKGGWTKYEFIVINGRRFRNVLVSNFLDNFLIPGDQVAIALSKWSFERFHYLAAVRDANGVVEKDDGIKTRFILLAFQIAPVVAVPAFLTGVILNDSAAGWIVFLVGVLGIPYLNFKSAFKARKILQKSGSESGWA